MSDELNPEKKSMLAELANRVRQIGREILNPARSEARRAIGKRDELIELRDKLLAERVIAQTKVDEGTLTTRATANIDRQLAQVVASIATIDNKLPQDLLTGCIDPALRFEFRKLLSARTVVLAKMRDLSQQEQNTRGMLARAQAHVASATAALETHPKHPQLLSERDDAQRREKQHTMELAAITEEQAAVAAERKAIESRLEDLKARMRNS